MADWDCPLHDVLNPIAVVRTTFETADMFADDADLHAEMMGIIRQGRADLIAALEKVAAGMREGLGWLTSDPEQFRKTVIQHMAQGWSPRSQSDFRLCDPIPPRFLLPPQVSRLGLSQVSGRQLQQLVVADLLERASVSSNYRDLATFTEEVASPYIGVLFLVYVAEDPMYYGGC